MSAPAVELTTEGLAAALELEAQGVDVRALVSQELVRQVQIGGSLAAYARKNGIRVREFTDNDGDAIAVVTNGRGAAENLPRPYVFMVFRRPTRRGSFARVRATFVENGDELYAGKGVSADIPDTATTPEAWIAFGESLVGDKVQAAYETLREEIERADRTARNDAILGRA